MVVLSTTPTFVCQCAVKLTMPIKGVGMRWNVTDLNALLTLRCIFLEQSWQTYWESCAQLAA